MRLDGNPRLPATTVFSALWCAALLSSSAAAQSSVRELLAAADSSFAAGHREEALRSYRAVLSEDSTNSRAVFRLAQLSDRPREALRWYLRYVELEPSDPWGYMAVGDALGQLGRTTEGLQWYDRAEHLAPGERDVALGRARLLARSGRSQQATQVYRDWLERHPKDVEAWRELGRELLRSGRPRRSIAALERAQSLEEDGATAARLAAARAQVAPAALAAAAYGRDSDGNTQRSVAVSGDIFAPDGARLRLELATASLEDGLNTAASRTATLSATLRPRSTLSLETAVGVAGLESSASTLDPRSAPLARLRARWSAPLAGPRAELRMSYWAVTYSPDLIAHRVARSELEGKLDLPLGPLRIKTAGRGARLSARGEDNARLAIAGGVGLPVPGGWELLGQYHRMGYRDSSRAGYFAPQLVEVVEAGSYWESEGERLSLALDLGAGIQRVAPHGGPVGSWQPSFRIYSQAYWHLSPGRYLGLELEGHDSQIAPQGLPTAQRWRYGSLALSIRWAL